MSYGTRWKTSDYRSIRSHRMDQSVTVNIGNDAGYRSRKLEPFYLTWQCVKIPVRIVDFLYSNVLRLNILMYWTLAGRLPKFFKNYRINAEIDDHLMLENQQLKLEKEQGNNDIGNLSGEIREKREEIHLLEKKNKSLRERVRTLETEKQEALTRLSEVVSVKLRDNNPNIVDLNDQCRPTKLAEMFSELYDNEWTGAYTILEEPFGEERSIVILLEVVMEAYGFCEEKVEAPWNVLMEWFLDMNLPGAQQTSKWLKDSRKARIRNKVQEVEKDYEQKLGEKFEENKLAEILSKNEMQQYITKCVELCLLMVTTDPPVVLNCTGWTQGLENQENAIIHENIADEKHYEKENYENSEEKDKHAICWSKGGLKRFDKELYKEYTTRGEYLDFVVWPALFLHKEGPMLSKGIAQGKKE